jgi:hypothetical protein
LINYGKCSFHNALNLSCSWWNLGYGLCFFQNELGLNYDLQSYQNLPSPSYGLHFHQNTFGPLCPFPNLGMTYIFIKTCMALIIVYMLFETCLALVTINIFVRMHLSHNNIFDFFLKHKLKFALVVNFIGDFWVLFHVTIKLFEALNIYGIILAKIVKPLLRKMINKIVFYVKDEGSNLGTLESTLSFVVNRGFLDLSKPYVGTCFGHLMSNGCYYVTSEEKV